MIKQTKILHIVISVSMILTGLVMILWPRHTAVALVVIVGSTTLISGILKIISYFVKDTYNLAFQFDLALGVFFCIIGTVLLIHPTNLVACMPITFGFLILIDAAFKIQTALDARIFGLTKWWLIIILAIVTGITGVFLILKPFDAASLLMIIMGIGLMNDGIMNLWVTAYTVRLLKHRIRR